MPKARFLNIEVLLNVVGRSQRVNRMVGDVRARTHQRLLFLALFEMVLRQMLRELGQKLAVRPCGQRRARPRTSAQDSSSANPLLDDSWSPHKPGERGCRAKRFSPARNGQAFSRCSATFP